MTKIELFEQIRTTRAMIKEKENDCDGTVELLEDYLSDLLDDIKSLIKEKDKEIKEAQEKGYNIRLPFLYYDRKELNNILYNF